MIKSNRKINLFLEIIHKICLIKAWFIKQYEVMYAQVIQVEILY